MFYTEDFHNSISTCHQGKLFNCKMFLVTKEILFWVQFHIVTFLLYLMLGMLISQNLITWAIFEPISSWRFDLWIVIYESFGRKTEIESSFHYQGLEKVKKTLTKIINYLLS